MTSTFTVINPATAEPIREIARASVEETDAAISRAVSAQRSWASLPPRRRADGLRSFARVVEAHVEELAQLEVRNSGHPIGAARAEASHVAQVLNFYAGSPERLSGQQIPVAGRDDHLQPVVGTDLVGEGGSEELVEAQVVAEILARTGRDLEPQAPIFGPGLDLIDGVPNQCGDIGRIEIELKLAGLELAQIEQLVHEAQEPAGVHAYVLDQRRLTLGRHARRSRPEPLG